jgi:hypothetical protein
MYKTFMLFAVLFPSVLFAQDIDWWDKSKNEFSLSTSAELEGFAALINEGYDDFSGKTINLSGDITLSGNWTPIKAFNGIFDGNGHSISGLSVDASSGNAGLFNSASGQIKNLTIEASIIFSGGRHAGVLAGSFGKIDIENVIVTADTVGVGSFGSSGGLIGYGEGNITIINSNFTGNILSWSSRCSGGLVGRGNATISNSYSKGNIMGSGLVGCGDDVTISNSYSTGDIRGGSGLVDSAVKITISDSYFIGEITANSSNGNNVNVGGLVGRNDNYRGSITISNSYSTSNITANSSNGNNGTNVNVGGLVGYGSYGSITISNSYSTGDIRANVSNGNNVNSVNVGGLVGSGNAEISNSYSTSNVTANVSNKNNVGGLIGSSNSLSIINSYASGTINSYASGTAQNGIAGNVPSSATKTFIGVYYNSEGASSAVNGTIAPGVKALSPEDLKKKASFAGWDFVNIWDIEEDESYPYLLPFPSGSSSSSYDAGNSSSSGDTPIRLPQIATANQVTQIRNGLNLQINDNAVLEIYGLKGNLIGRQNFKSGVYNVSLGYLPKGMYIVKATFGSKKQVLRIPVM